MLQGSSPVQVDAHRHLHVGRGVPWHPAGVLPARLPQPHVSRCRSAGVRAVSRSLTSCCACMLD
eukprot:351937-Chlamydomonas_euryale.AAC.11